MRRALPAWCLVAAACAPTLPPRGEAAAAFAAPAPDPTLPDALALCARHVEATGLRAVLEAHDSVHVRGTVERPAQRLEGTFELFRARPALSAMQLRLPGVGETDYGCDGTRAWMAHPLLGPRVLEGADRVKACASAAWDALLRRPEGLEVYATVAREPFEGRACHVVFGRWADPPGAAPSDPALRSFREYYDAETGLLAGVVEPSGSSEGPVVVTRVLGDYAPLAGSLVARRTEQRSPDLTLVFRVEDVRYGGVEQDAFEAPAAVEALLAR